MWYTKYLDTYERSLDEVSPDRFDSLRQQIERSTSDHPVVSVIAIAHNEEKHLMSCLSSLADNVVDEAIEIVVVNNNSTDGTESLLQKLGVRYFNETKKGPGHARQCGLDNARGEYHLCIDADTIYPPYYICTMLKALRRKNVACAYGLWSFLPDQNMSRCGLFFYELMRDLYLRVQQIRRPELNVRGMVFAFKTDLARQYGFRTDIIRGEDGSLALNLKADGRLVLVTSRKARPITGNGTVGKDGGLWGMFTVRLKKALRGFTSLFTSKTHYEDHEDNML